MTIPSKNRSHSADEMVATQIIARNIKDQLITTVFQRIPRHLFVGANEQSLAYEDQPLPIGYGQTISQPYIVALMIAVMQIDRSARVLEIGTGSGYETAILAHLAGEIYTIERIRALSLRAQKVLAGLGLMNITYQIGNGCLGWPEYAPFSHIIVTAASAEIPPALTEQIALGGKLLIPLGAPDSSQELTLIEKTPLGLKSSPILPVRFVPLIDNDTFSNKPQQNSGD